MLSKQQIVSQLKDKNLSEVARKTGLTRATLSALVNNPQYNPTYKTLDKIEIYLIKESQQ